MQPPRVVFLDIWCPSPYDNLTSSQQAQGGTESTTARVAEGLALQGYDVTVAQHNRKRPSENGVAYYCSFDDLVDLPKPQFVIPLRTANTLPWAKERWPSAKTFLWCHDENYNDLVSHQEIIEETESDILAVSRYHKQRIQDAFLSRSQKFPKFRVDFVYNPVVCAENVAPTDPNRFVFFSSPHKGLENTLKQFAHIRRALPEATLSIANPGYKELDFPLPEGATILGKLSHTAMMEYLATAFAVLHLNDENSETFGIVHGEANFYGVPVLTTGLGANREVLNPPGDQVIDVTSAEQVVERLLSWRKHGRPKVSLKPEFKLESVISRWREILR